MAIQRGSWTTLIVAFSFACVSPLKAAEAEARAAVKAMMPQASIDSISQSAASGYFEVVSQGQIIYVSDDGKHVMTGELWQVDDRANLTLRRKDGIRHDAISAVGAERRIVFEAEDAKHRVTVLTDFDCGYCQKMHQDIAQYNARGISVEYLLFPRGGLGSPSFTKAVSVWCADDRAKTFTLAKSGVEPSTAMCPNPIAENYELVTSIGGITGTPTVIDDHGGMTGYQSPDQMLARLESAR